MEPRNPSRSPVAYTFVLFLAMFCLLSRMVNGKPVDDALYKDTEEILRGWENDDSYYEDEPEKSFNSAEAQDISYLPPVLVEHEPSSTKTTTTTTVKPQPVFFPGTDIELGSLFEQVGRARRKEVPEPVDLPVPYIVWTKDGSGRENRFNYWQRFYNTVYKVD